MFSLPLRQTLPLRAALSAGRQADPSRHFLQTCLRQYSSSSSKPSSPSDNRPRNITPASTARRRGGLTSSPAVDGVTGSESEFVRGQRAYSRLPFVPNTDHMNASEVAASSFFALHRPLSIQNSVPQAHTQSSFSSIFDPLMDPSATASTDISKDASPFANFSPVRRPRGGNLERISMGDLDSLISSLRDNWLTGSAKQTFLASTTSNPNSSNQNENLDDLLGQNSEPTSENPMEILAKLLPPLSGVHTHLPFHPPPPPVPQTASSTETPASQKHLVTFQQTTFPNGMIMITARTKYITPVTSPYMQRIRDKQKEYMENWQRTVMEGVGKAGVSEEGEIERRRAEEMIAISVRRQRKLKMKKHKYKKLMKRTRNERRRLEKK